MLLYFTWLLSLGLASRDSSAAIDATYSSFIPLQYRTWLLVDGYLTLTLAIYSIISSCLVQIPSYSKIFIFGKIFALVCKLIWLSLGMSLFFFLDTQNCSSTLLILSLLYYTTYMLVFFRSLGKLSELAGSCLS